MIRSTLVGAALCAAVFGAPAVAADEVPPVILVVGQRDAPIAIEPRGLSVSLGPEQMSGVDAANVEDLMRYAPDFFVRSRYIGDNNGVPGFRGTHSTQSARSLVMVDGFVISNFLGNSYSYPPAWGVVSPTEVAQFDIVYGPYSARYAGNSMGGIVNITTKAPKRTQAFATVRYMAQDYAEYGTRDSLTGTAAEVGFAFRQNGGPVSLRVSARRLRNHSQPMQYYQPGYNASVYNDPAAGTPVVGAYADSRLIPVTGTDVRAPVVGDYSSIATRQDQARAQLRYDAGDVHGEALFAYWWNVDKTLHPRTYLRDSTGRPFYGSSADSGLVSIEGHSYPLDPAQVFRLGISRKDEWLAGVKLEVPIGAFTLSSHLSTLRFARMAVRQSNGYGAGLIDGAGQSTVQGPTGWYTGDVLATGTLNSHDLAFGVSANEYDTDQSVFATTNWRTGSGRHLRSRTFGKTWLVGVFAEDAIALGSGVTLTVGAREEFWRAYSGGLTQAVSAGLASQRYRPRTARAFSPKLSLKGKLAPGWGAELSLATATRFPTVGELFQGSLNGDGSFNADSFDPGLKPEKSRDANLVVRHAMGPLDVTASLFYQQVKDAIFSYTGFDQNNVSTFSFKNIDVTRQVGLELIAQSRDWPLTGLDMEANAAWIDAVTVRNRAAPASEGVQFPRIPHWRLAGNVRYRLTPRLHASLGARYASRPNSDLDGLQRGDAYGFTSELFSLDAKLDWRLSPNLALSGAVENLTSFKAYVFHPFPQRSFSLQMAATL